MQRIRSIASVGALALLALCVSPTGVEAKERPTGADFELRDANGVTHRLSSHRGKWVVLEWVDFSCAPVQAQYRGPQRKMQTLQQTYKARGVVWFSISSAGQGQRGHMTPSQHQTALNTWGAQPTALLLDGSGKVGKAFRVKVTPEVRVISPQGRVVYAGGVESQGSTPVRYLDAVLRAAVAGQALPHTSESAFGTPIAYAGKSGTTATGPKAPDFRLVDSYGKTRTLSEFRGKWVILEWVNYDCPYVKKHYHSSHRRMQKLQSRARSQGVVWLSICSSAPGKQGYFTPTQAEARRRQLGATPVAYLHDPRGTVGKTYRATTTPDIRIISPQGTIEYSGGIDSIRSARPSDVAQAKNFVALALADIAAGRPIATRSSRSYGCSVKY